MQKNISEILQKGRMAGAGEAEDQEMLALFHQAENEYELKNHLLEELKEFEIKEKSSVNFTNLFSSLWGKIEKRKSQLKFNTRIFNNVVKIAAVIVLGIFIGIYTVSLINKQDPVYYSAHSPSGSVSEMILPDGSVIFLNADSRIKYSIEGENGNREVFLDGEAWFEVQKNKKKPFIVHTGYYDVNVTGTQFNVKAYSSENEVITTLEEGEVYINSTEQLKLSENIKLNPGEQIVLAKNSNEIEVKTVNTQWFTSWKDNTLIFVNMSLQELIVLLERKYGVDIIVKNKDILDLHFDGTIKNETIIEILDIIKTALPVNYKVTDQKIEIEAK
jgi:ferric-dicitrate binding protein FerR (iron transport regulator)